jgi:hypothetical protein
MATVWKFEARIRQADGRSSSKTCFVAIADLRDALAALERNQNVSGTNPGELLSEEEVATTLGYSLKEGDVVCL